MNLLYLRFEYFSNGIILNGGVPNSDPHALDPAKERYGVKMGLNAPIEKPIFRNLHFSKMGTKYTPSFDESYGFVRPWNTKGAIIRNVEFYNLEEDPIVRKIHAVYGYWAVDTLIENSVFDTVTSDPIRYRHGGNWTVRNNTFRQAGYAANVSEWFTYKSLADTYVDDSGPNIKRLSECASDPIVGSSSNNTTDGLDYYGNDHYTSGGVSVPFTFSKVMTDEQSAPCVDPARIYAPETSGEQTGEGKYRIEWTTPRTMSGSVTQYSIYRGDTNDLRGQLVDTVPASTHSYELTNLPSGEDVYFYVLAENTAGGVSPRTDNRLWFNLTPYADSFEDPAPIDRPEDTLPVDRVNTEPVSVDTNKSQSLAETGQSAWLVISGGLAAVSLAGVYLRRLLQ